MEAQHNFTKRRENRRELFFSFSFFKPLFLLFFRQILKCPDIIPQYFNFSKNILENPPNFRTFLNFGTGENTAHIEYLSAYITNGED